MGHSCSCSCQQTASATNNQTQHDHASGIIPAEYRMPLLSALMLAGGLLMSQLQWTLFTRPVSLLWYLLAFLPVGWPVLKEAFENIRRKSIFNEFTLMTLACAGAFYIGEYPEAVAVMLFYAVGELFQAKAVNKARRDIRALLDVRPQTATVIRNGVAETVNPESVETGETIEVKAGERLPLDGVLLQQAASFNTAALTGESMPRTYEPGEEVMAGMIATDRVVRVRVSRPFDQSSLARILEMVQNATERKARPELLIRRLARVYTPIVTGLAALIVLIPFLYSLVNPAFGFIFNDWLYRALVFLVISCPCALVVSIPLGYFGGIGAASRRGILFKGSNYLDAITRINTVVFDKTGTLTEGAFEVRQAVAGNGFSEADVIRMIASAELYSTHPIARAIVDHAENAGIALGEMEHTEEIAGYGLRARSRNRELLVGNARLMQLNAVSMPAELQNTEDTVVCVAENGTFAGYLLLADRVKPDTVEALYDLRIRKGMSVHLLSGDRKGIVERLAREWHLDNYRGDLLPEEKLAYIERLRQEPANQIAFVGDGINDAPVLAGSHLGIAMGGLGSDVAIETADIVIQTDQPSKVGEAIRIGKLTQRVILQNIGMALGVKFFVLLLGALGMATLWEAVFADVGVALLAILNAVRIQSRLK